MSTMGVSLIYIPVPGGHYAGIFRLLPFLKKVWYPILQSFWQSQYVPVLPIVPVPDVWLVLWDRAVMDGDSLFLYDQLELFSRRDPGGFFPAKI